MNQGSVVKISTDRIDMREHVIDCNPQTVSAIAGGVFFPPSLSRPSLLSSRVQVITQDNVMIDIDSILYFRITDARLAVYNIQNLPDAIELLTQATLRDIIAGMNLDDTFSSREEINDRLLSKIQLDCERWGVVITRIEIFNILPPGGLELSVFACVCVCFFGLILTVQP